MKVLASLLLLLCIGASAVPLASIDATAIDTVSVDIAVSVLGPGTSYHAIYHRRDANTLASDDGKTITQSDLAELVRDLSLPPAATFDFSRTWITPEYLQSQLDAVEQHYLGPHRSDPKVEPIFRKAFLDWAELKRRCEERMAMDMHVTDYYPHLKVTLNTESRAVILTTDSQREFMVPIDVESDGVSQSTWDPSLAVAIGNLIGAKAPMARMLWGWDVAPQWASYAQESRDVVLAINGKDDRAPAFRTPFFEDPCGMPGHPYAPY